MNMKFGLFFYIISASKFLDPIRLRQIVYTVEYQIKSNINKKFFETYNNDKNKLTFVDECLAAILFWAEIKKINFAIFYNIQRPSFFWILWLREREKETIKWPTLWPVP